MKSALIVAGRRDPDRRLDSDGMERGEERCEERWSNAAEEPARKACEGRRAEGAGRDREGAEVTRLAAEALVDQAQRHHRQRAIVGLARRGAAVLDAVQRLAEGVERLALRPQQGARPDGSLVLPHEGKVDGREIQHRPRERGDQRREQERQEAAGRAVTHGVEVDAGTANPQRSTSRSK
jgi:hypothetical protein